MIRGFGSGRVGLCEVWTGMLAWGFIAIACATADAVAEATLVMSSHVSATWVWRHSIPWAAAVVHVGLQNDRRNELFWPRDSQYSFGSQSDILFGSLQWATKPFACLEVLDCVYNRRQNKMWRIIQIFTNMPYHPTYMTNKESRKLIGSFPRYHYFVTQVTF